MAGKITDPVFCDQDGNCIVLPHPEVVVTPALQVNCLA